MKDFCIIEPTIETIPIERIELIVDIIKEYTDKEKNNA